MTEPLGARLHPHVPAAAGSEWRRQRSSDIVASGASRGCEQQGLTNLPVGHLMPAYMLHGGLSDWLNLRALAVLCSIEKHRQSSALLGSISWALQGAKGRKWCHHHSPACGTHVCIPDMAGPHACSATVTVPSVATFHRVHQLLQSHTHKQFQLPVDRPPECASPYVSVPTPDPGAPPLRPPYTISIGSTHTTA